MECANRVTNRGKSNRRGFYDEKPFLRRFDLALPAIDRFDPRDDVRARGQLLFDQVARDFAGFFFGAGRGEDDSFVGHIKSAVRYWRVSQAPIAERVALLELRAETC